MSGENTSIPMPALTTFLYPDYTVGFGISPNLQGFLLALGLYRRWGHSPRPKSLTFSLLKRKSKQKEKIFGTRFIKIT